MEQIQKSQSAPERVYKDLQPYFEWIEDEASSTLILMLPGFTKEQLRVQVTSKGVLRINCEKQGIENLWHRFGKEFPIPQYCDTNDVNAKFERGVLSVKFPKLITPENKPQEQETITNPPHEEASMTRQNSNEPKTPTQAQETITNPPHEETSMARQNSNEDKAQTQAQETITNLPQEEASMARQNSNEPKGQTQAQVVDERRETPKEEEKENDKIEEKVENAQKNVKTNDEPSKTKEVVKAHEGQGQGKRHGKITQRLKTRILDFNISLRSKDDKDVDELGVSFGDTKPKKGKMLMNMFVTTLLVLVIGVYVKNAFWA